MIDLASVRIGVTAKTMLSFCKTAKELRSAFMEYCGQEQIVTETLILEKSTEASVVAWIHVFMCLSIHVAMHMIRSTRTSDKASRDPVSMLYQITIQLHNMLFAHYTCSQRNKKKQGNSWCAEQTSN